MIHSRAAADIHFHLLLQENVTCPEVCCNSEWRQTATRPDQHRHHHSAGKISVIQGRFLSISDHHTNSLFTLILCLLFISSVLGAVMCVVALLQCVEQRAAQLCSPTMSCSFHVVFFFLYLQSCVIEGQAYQRFSFFFSTRLIFKVCNSEDIFTVNAFFFLVEGEIYCHFYQCTV